MGPLEPRDVVATVAAAGRAADVRRRLPVLQLRRLCFLQWSLEGGAGVTFTEGGEGGLMLPILFTPTLGFLD